MSSSWPVSNLPKSLHLLEELERYMMPGFLLHDCSFDELVSLAKRTYLVFGSTCSAHMALSRDENNTVEYFGCYLDPQVDTYFQQFDVLQVHDEGSAVPVTSGEPRDAGEREDDEGGDDNEIGINHLASIDLLFGEDHPRLALQEPAHGDVLKYNTIMLWHNLLHYWEMKQSAKEGDVGCLFEMNKVHTLTIVVIDHS